MGALLCYGAYIHSASLPAQAQAADLARYGFVVVKQAEIKPTSHDKAFTMGWQPAGESRRRASSCRCAGT